MGYLVQLCGRSFLVSAVNGSLGSTRLLALLHIWTVFFGASLGLARAFYSSLRAEFLFYTSFLFHFYFSGYFLLPQTLHSRGTTKRRCITIESSGSGFAVSGRAFLAFLYVFIFSFFFMWFVFHV